MNEKHAYLMESPKTRSMVASADAWHEHSRARQQHGPMRSPHEGLGVIDEEWDELKREIYAKDFNPFKARKEAIQLAAMCLAFASEVCDPRMLNEINARAAEKVAKPSATATGELAAEQEKRYQTAFNEQQRAAVQTGLNAGASGLAAAPMSDRDLLRKAIADYLEVPAESIVMLGL